MNGNIGWIFELTINEGKLNELKTLMEELVSVTKANEPDTIAYEWTLSEDGKRCHIHERYANDAAVLKHLDSFVTNFAARLMATGEATYFMVYGNPSEEVKEALEGFNGSYMTPIGGFIRV